MDTKLQSFEDVNLKYDFFHESISLLLEMHAPLKPLTNKQIKESQKPWVDKYIISLIKTNQLYGHFMQTGDHNSFLEYKTLRNNINHSLRKNKIIYYRNYFNKFRNNIKKFWKGVNEFIGRSKTSNNQSSITQNGKSLTNPKTIADAFNLYFTNVASNLVKKLPKNKNHRSFRSYLKNPCASSMFLHAITPKKVSDVISSLNVNKAIDFYNFPTKIIKDINNIIKK